MKQILLAFSICTCILFGCNNSKTTDDQNALSADSTSMNDATLTGPSSQMPESNTDASASTPASIDAGAPSATPSVVTAEGMNPEHGKPGHRCDISVGAPLSSAPATPPASGASQVSTPSFNTPSSAPTMVPTQITPTSPQMSAPASSAPGASSPASTVTAPGMNPPHGQPGHDCAVAVGAPLKK